MNETNKIYGLRLKWLGCACYEMDFGGLTVVNDPWITPNQGTELTWEAVEKCDYITLTHSHFDHIMDIPKIVEKFHPYVLCGEFTAVPLMKWTNMNPMDIYPMPAGLELDFDAVKIKGIYGRHNPLPGSAKERVEQAKNHPVQGKSPELIELRFWGDLEYRHYLYTMPSGAKLLILGNKLARPEQRNILREVKPDIAILQISSSNPIPEIVKTLKETGCNIVLPHHFDFPKDYSKWVSELGNELKEHAPEIRYIVPEYGKWITL